MEAQLRLFFSGATTPQLDRVEFAHPELGKKVRISVRGRTEGPDLDATGTFTWTRGVQAFAAAFAWWSSTARFTPPAPPPKISGRRKTLAATLNDAITNPSSWLRDMFGEVSMQGAFIGRLIGRTNRDFKTRPDQPVVLYLQEQELPARHIHIRMDAADVTDPEELEGLARQLAVDWEGAFGPDESRRDVCLWLSRAKPPAPPTNRVDASPVKTHRDMLRSVLSADAHLQLAELLGGPDDMFRRRVVGMAKNESILRRVPNLGWLNELRSDTANTTDALGIARVSDLQRCLGEHRPISIAVSPTLIGSCVLFQYCKSVLTLNIDNNYSFSHAAGLVDAVLQHRVHPDFCAVVLAPALRLLTAKKLKYRMCDMLPRQSYRVVAPPGIVSGEIGAGEFVFVQDGQAGAMFQFERLVRDQAIDLNRVRTRDIEPYRVMSAVRQGGRDMRAIIWSPYPGMIEQTGNGKLIDDPSRENRWEDVALLVNSEFEREHPTQAAAIMTAVRSAWFDMIDVPSRILTTIDSLLDDPDYFRTITRTLGLFMGRL